MAAPAFYFQNLPGAGASFPRRPRAAAGSRCFSARDSPHFLFSSRLRQKWCFRAARDLPRCPSRSSVPFAPVPPSARRSPSPYAPPCPSRQAEMVLPLAPKTKTKEADDAKMFCNRMFPSLVSRPRRLRRPKAPVSPCARNISRPSPAESPPPPQKPAPFPPSHTPRRTPFPLPAKKKARNRNRPVWRASPSRPECRDSPVHTPSASRRK